MWVKRLESATDEQLDKIGNIWTESLKDAWLVRSGAGFDPNIMALSFRARAQMVMDDGFLWVAGDEDGVIQGAAHCLPPGWSVGESRTRKDGLPGFEELFDPKTLIWKKKTFLPWVMSAIERAYQLRNTTVRASYYVSMLGVQVSAQGKGVGAALIRAIQAEAAKEGVPVTLICGELPNVPWYLKLGFKEVMVERLEVQERMESMSLLIWTRPI